MFAWWDSLAFIANLRVTSKQVAFVPEVFSLVKAAIVGVDVGFVAIDGFWSRALSVVVGAVVRHASDQHHPALRRPIQRKA